MSLIVEDGSVVPGAESYLSVAEADAFAAKNGNPSGWSNAFASVPALLGSANAVDGDTIVIDQKTYTFQTTLTDVDGNVQIGGTGNLTLINLTRAVNLTGTPGVDYANSMTLHPTVSAAIPDPENVGAARFTAKNCGADTNYPVSSSNKPWITFDADTLEGGTDRTSTSRKEAALRDATRAIDNIYGARWQGCKVESDQSLDWPRIGVCCDGFTVDSDEIPQQLKDAVAFMAFDSVAGTDLQPDDETGGAGIKRTKDKVAVLETEVEYFSPGASADGSAVIFTRSDQLIRCFLGAGGLNGEILRT